MSELSHFDDCGASRMVDTSGKPETLREARASGLVRMAPATAALPGSRLLPLDQLAARAAEVDPPAGIPVVVYCHHGIRSRSGAALLEHLGWPDVVSLAGGIDAWSLDVDPRVPRY